ncbi:type I phosphomannose isomerase catalytic subunit [Candidatus Hydrogenedentota bacterium]
MKPSLRKAHMNESQPYPLMFREVYVEKIWGGRRMVDVFAKNHSMDVPIGESWELADRQDPEETSVVTNGPLAGKSLTDVIALMGKDLMGDVPLNKFGRFPLLIKILDAEDVLSVQVHPSDEQAAQFKEPDPGKTEMWYVLDADEGSELVCGLKPGVTREDLEAALEKGAVEDLMAHIPVQAGDSVFITTGTIHALGKGILAAEIQVNSDLTYRLYDWGRVGLDGKPRRLDIEKSMVVIDFNMKQPEILRSGPVDITSTKEIVLAECEFFDVNLADNTDENSLASVPGSCTILFVVSGDCTLGWNGEKLTVAPGTTVLVPAALKDVTVSGTCRYMRTFIPN